MLADEDTGDRTYFVWNKIRYPEPRVFGSTLEEELDVKVDIPVLQIDGP